MQYLSKEVSLEMLEFIRHQTEFIMDTTSDVTDLNKLLTTQIVQFNLHVSADNRRNCQKDR